MLDTQGSRKLEPWGLNPNSDKTLKGFAN